MGMVTRVLEPILILSTEDRGHLRTLARLSRFLGEPQFLADIRAAADAVETHRVIEQFEQAHLRGTECDAFFAHAVEGDLFVFVGS